MNTFAELKHKDVTGKILHAFFKIVYPQLGYGFLEKENPRFQRPSASSLKARLTFHTGDDT